MNLIETAGGHSKMTPPEIAAQLALLHQDGYDTTAYGQVPFLYNEQSASMVRALPAARFAVSVVFGDEAATICAGVSQVSVLYLPTRGHNPQGQRSGILRAARREITERVLSQPDTSFVLGALLTEWDHNTAAIYGRQLLSYNVARWWKKCLLSPRGPLVVAQANDSRLMTARANRRFRIDIADA